MNNRAVSHRPTLILRAIGPEYMGCTIAQEDVAPNKAVAGYARLANASVVCCPNSTHEAESLSE